MRYLVLFLVVTRLSAWAQDVKVKENIKQQSYDVAAPEEHKPLLQPKDVGREPGGKKAGKEKQ